MAEEDGPMLPIASNAKGPYVCFNISFFLGRHLPPAPIQAQTGIPKGNDHRIIDI